ncbi:MAG: RtcB family protein, partial [Solobacterium sp.]|nr:RtcB family protein [Solobacterium sp.]
MKDGCILAVGKGNPEWNESAPHGAGRIMSRTRARHVLSLQDYQNEMQGIYTTSVSAETLDEAPQAYKPQEAILNVINETVEVREILKPVYNFKASE